MQFLRITSTTTLSDLAKVVGQKNVDSILVANGLLRTPDVGKQLAVKVAAAKALSGSVNWQTKSTILNNYTGDADIFESTCLLSENGWKVMATLGTFENYLRIPETITLKDSVDIIGGTSEGISTTVYKKVMDQLKTGDHIIDPIVFNSYSTSKPTQMDNTRKSTANEGIYSAFSLPWGKITLYSSLADDSVEFPVYPEELEDGKKADYDEMPDLLYQYEPWYTYKSSGPRSLTYTFRFHRDMWTGDHTDGKANELIRFCEASCYPEYDGSAVNTSTVTLYINGQAHIHGIMTAVNTTWAGPIGQDGWYLECTLELNITEVSTSALSFASVRSKNLIG